MTASVLELLPLSQTWERVAAQWRRRVRAWQSACNVTEPVD
jgi:hypothetical protein